MIAVLITVIAVLITVIAVLITVIAVLITLTSWTFQRTGSLKHEIYNHTCNQLLAHGNRTFNQLLVHGNYNVTVSSW